MRAVVFLIVLVATRATAGVIDARSFDQGRSDEKLVVNGVAATNTGGFTLYQHGVWQAPAAVEAPVASAERGREAAESVTAIPAVAPDALQDPCASRGLPWRRGLSSRTAIGRIAYWPLVRDAECRHGLPVGLLDALVLQESRYQPAAVSPAGAAGLAQLMPATAAGLGVADRFEPVANLDGGARYLRSMLDRFQSVPLALAAYNAGAGSVKRAGGIPLNRETPGYVRSVLGFWNQAVDWLPNFEARSQAILLSFSSSNQE